MQCWKLSEKNVLLRSTRIKSALFTLRFFSLRCATRVVAIFVNYTKAYGFTLNAYTHGVHPQHSPRQIFAPLSTVRSATLRRAIIKMNRARNRDVQFFAKYEQFIILQTQAIPRRRYSAVGGFEVGLAALHCTAPYGLKPHCVAPCERNSRIPTAVNHAAPKSADSLLHVTRYATRTAP